MAERYPEIAALIEEKISELAELERGKSSSLDKCAITSGEMMRGIFSYGRSGTEKEILGEIGFSVGIWVYLIDALDDYDDDVKSGAYNPLIYRSAGLDGLKPLMYDRLSRISNGIDLLEIKKNKGIIDNIIMMGMRAQTDRVLQKIAEDGEGGGSVNREGDSGSRGGESESKVAEVEAENAMTEAATVEA